MRSRQFGPCSSPPCSRSAGTLALGARRRNVAERWRVRWRALVACAASGGHLGALARCLAAQAGAGEARLGAGARTQHQLAVTVVAAAR